MKNIKLFKFSKDVNIGEVDNDEIESIGDFVSESEEAESCDEVQSDDDESHLFNGNGSYSLVINNTSFIFVLNRYYYCS